MRYHRIAAMVALALIAMASCRGTVNRVSRPQLGTIVTVTFIGDPAGAGAVSAAVFDEIDRVEGLMSPRRAGSDVARINEGAARAPVRVKDETYALLRRAVLISRETDGTFDVTFAALERLWDFRNPNFAPPSRADVASLLPLVDYRNLKLEGGSVAFARPGMKIGLGAIAKGYAVERGIAVLKSRGVRHGIVEAGGDLQAIGTRGGRGWKAGLRHPRKESILLTIDLEDGDAVATSGDYERCVVRGGRRYHHIIDPRTGYPAEGYSSVTVISKSAVLSDAYATALFVMGPARARVFLKRHAEIDVVMVDLDMNLLVSTRLRGRLAFIEKLPVTWQ